MLLIASLFMACFSTNGGVLHVQAAFSTTPMVVAALDHTIALKADGTVWGLGGNAFGQLGNGTLQSKQVPEQVTSLSDVIAVAAGERHTAAVKSDGTVWTWGFNTSGQLGDGSSSQRNSPVQVSGVSGISDIVDIAAGSWHTVALKSDGTVWAWGTCYYHSADYNYDDGRSGYKIPVQISGLTGVSAITAGSNHTAVLKSDGTVWMWGDNTYGQLGDGTTQSRQVPGQVLGLSDIVAIGTGAEHTVALKQDGTIWAWGSNTYGQLGDGTETNSYTPVQIPTISGVSAIAVGAYSTVAVKSYGTVWTWGNNLANQLGDGTTLNRKTPVQVKSLAGVISIGAGSTHAVALTEGGTLWGWGNSTAGKIGIDAMESDSSVPVRINLSEGGAAFTLFEGVETEITLDTAPSYECVLNATILIDGSFRSSTYNAPDISMFELTFEPNDKPNAVAFGGDIQIKGTGDDGEIMFSIPLKVIAEGRYKVCIDVLGKRFEIVVKTLLNMTNPNLNGFIVPPNQDTVPSNAIHIKTASELAAIGGTQSAGKHYVLDNDINLTSDWTPIEDFNGTFDGRGYSIRNLYVLEGRISDNNPWGTPLTIPWAGLFGTTLEDAVIKNVAVHIGAKGIRASGLHSIPITSYTGYNGGLIGYATGGTVANCYVVGDLSSVYYTGGLIGHITGGSITDCYTTGNITSTRTTEGSVSSSRAGGLFGGISGGSITNCFTIGNITSTSYAGGLAGSAAKATISNCYSTGNIATVSYAGGLVGLASGTFTGCYASGNVEAFSQGNSAYAGGLIGLAGYDPLFVHDCYAMGQVTASSSSSFSEDTVGAGGLLGSAGGPVVFEAVEIARCYALGDVLAFATLPANYFRPYAYAGGLIGTYSTSYTTISDCYRLSTQSVASDRPIKTDGTPLSDAQMKTKLSYNGWDFNSTWAVNTRFNYGYPYLLAIPSLRTGGTNADEILTALTDAAGSIDTLNAAATTHDTLSGELLETLTNLIEDYESMNEEEKQKLDAGQAEELDSVRDRMGELNHTDGDVSISGAAWNIRVDAEQRIASDPEYSDIELLLRKGSEIRALFDIQLTRSGADYTLPSGQTMTVTIEGNFSDETVDTLRVFHVKQDLTTEYIKPSGVTDSQITFDTSSFSTFAVVYGATWNAILGDVNGDERISIADVDVAYRAFRGMLTLDETQLLAADVNKDGKLTIADVDAIYRAFRGLLTLE